MYLPVNCQRERHNLGMIYTEGVNLYTYALRMNQFDNKPFFKKQLSYVNIYPKGYLSLIVSQTIPLCGESINLFKNDMAKDMHVRSSTCLH